MKKTNVLDGQYHVFDTKTKEGITLNDFLKNREEFKGCTSDTYMKGPTYKKVLMCFDKTHGENHKFIQEWFPSVKDARMRVRGDSTF